MSDPSEDPPLLRVEDLRVEFPTEDGVVKAVDGITYEVGRGRTLGIVGESGSGKTVAAMTVLGLTRVQGARITGRVLFEGRDLLGLDEAALRRIRGNEIAMIFQDPSTALHPLYRVGAQTDRGGESTSGCVKGPGPRAHDRAAGPRRDPRPGASAWTTTRTSSPEG